MSRRTPTQRDTVLRLLREAGGRGVTTSEFLTAHVGARYGGRIHELRQDGYEITTERLGPGQARYKLIGEPPSAPAPAERGAPEPGGAPPSLFLDPLAGGPYGDRWS